MILNVGLAVKSLNGLQKLTEATEVQTQLLTLSDVEDEKFFQSLLDLIVWQPEFSSNTFPSGFKKFLSENQHARLVIYNISDVAFVLPPVAKERVLLTLHSSLNKESVKSILKNTLQFKLQSAERLLDTLVEETVPDLQIIGNSKTARNMREFITLISKSPFTPCLIRGERGTEKTEIARMIHANGRNNGAPIRYITCASHNGDDLAEKLFGVAMSNRNQAGIVELSNGGTIVLEDIELIGEDLQKRLQVLLETNFFRRIGAAVDIQIKARVVATTDYDLEKFVLDGRFSRELYFRLKAFELSIPPLRSRSEDLGQMIPYYINIYNNSYGHQVKGVTETVFENLSKYKWPGNVAELKLVIEHAVLLTRSGYITPEVLPSCIMNQNADQHTAGLIGNCSLRDLEKLHIERVLLRTKGNKSRAAQILNISRTTLREKLRNFDLDQVYQIES